MIKKLFTLGLAIAAFAVNAQQAKLTKNPASALKLGGGYQSVMATTNLGFETWASGKPTGWTTLNLLGLTSAVQYTTSPGTGTSSLQLSTVSCTACPTYGIPTKAGFAQQVTPYVGQPTTLSFQYKSNVAAGDTGIILVSLSAAGAATGQSGYIFAGAAVTTWTTVTVPFQYSNAVNSDTISILITSSDSGLVNGTGIIGHPNLASKVYIDAIAINNPAGIQKIFTYSDYVMFPNPASAELNFVIKNTEASKIEVYDISGRVLNSIAIQNERTQIYTNEMNSGMYFYRVLDRSGNVLHIDKFNVVK